MTIDLNNRLEEAIHLENNGDLVSALKAYRDVYAADSHCQNAILGLGRVSLALGRIELAFDFFVKLLIENHNHPWGYWGRAAVYFEYNQNSRAFKEVQHALELDVPPTDLRIDCAALLNDHGYFNDALLALNPLPITCFDDDAQIEWCYASIKTNDINSICTQFLNNHLDDSSSIWILLRGMMKNIVQNNSGDNLIQLALSMDPDLSDKL